MGAWFHDSLETTLCGLAAGIGLLLVVLGLLFDKDEALKAGITIVSATVVFMGILAKSVRQDKTDKARLKDELREELQREVHADVQRELEKPPENLDQERTG